jgi:hypothetical protein
MPTAITRKTNVMAEADAAQIGDDNVHADLRGNAMKCSKPAPNAIRL